ncbi:hypothetical protein CARG_09135 [Corynebacterium argentoratense DSM 44202]|uniref:DUF3068 domain-containing protein n=1 Tax=Corynebacterium argentoratense DSM 44202 TaxID=1348662 RepID=U3GYR3_9CORY|nr:DUF3068 domain-containing protein [Corynebacterium argentoratense]AGU15923.1 hypothetical protein CARG_09135 [Corynebacterium argentoratense DSM 44202]
MAATAPQRILVGLGTFLFVLSILIPTVLVPRLRVIPLDAGGRTVTEETTATLFDARAFATNTALDQYKNDPDCTAEGDLPTKCFIGNTPVQGVRNISTVEPSDKKLVTLRAGNVLMRLDKNEAEALISATVDTVTLDRRSAYPKEDSTFYAVAPDLGLDDSTGAFQREGLQYQFPFHSERKSYPYFDTTAQTAHPIDYLDDETRHDVNTYTYTQKLDAVNMFDAIQGVFTRDGNVTDKEKAALAGLRMRSTAGRWYSPSELQERGLKPDDNIVMTRYYTVERTLNVEPTTGVIVMGQEKLHYFFASTPEEADTVVRTGEVSPYRTALRVDAQWNSDTQDAQTSKATEGRTKLKALATARYISLLLGVAMLLWAAYSIYRSRRTTS